MKSILFLTEAIYCNIFRYIFLRNEKNVVHFFSFFHFINLDSTLNIFKKWMTPIADVFMNLWSPKNMVRLMSKQSRFRGPFFFLRFVNLDLIFNFFKKNMTLIADVYLN